MPDEKRGGQTHLRALLSGFTKVVNDCQLIDLGSVGDKFTWEKSRGKENWVQERLDRGLSTQEWRNLFSNAEVKPLDVAPSDHLPIYLHLNKKVYVPKNKRFRFESTWIKEAECLNLVKSCWETAEGMALLDKINLCCLRLEEWGGGITMEYKQKIMACKEKLRKFRSRRDSQGIQTYNVARWEYVGISEFPGKIGDILETACQAIFITRGRSKYEILP